MIPKTIYLDHAATSWPKPARVLEAMTLFLQHEAANPGRSGHRMAVATERMLSDVRLKLARLVDGDDPNCLILCFNGTDALNIAIKGVLSPGDHAVTTMLEHNSVSRPLQAMADAGLITLTRVPCGPRALIDPDDVRRAIGPKTRLIACSHASNVTGTVQPIEEIGRLARERDVPFLVDAAQTMGARKVSVKDAHIDLLAFSGHKGLQGPPGTGALYVSPRVTLRPFREGGTGADSKTPTQPREFPFWLEAGTPNTVGFAGLSAALNGLDHVAAGAHERGLIGRFLEAVSDRPQVKVVGDTDLSRHVGTVSLLVEGLEPVEVAAILDQSFGIAVRGGLQCAPYAHRELGTYPDGTVRVSVGPTSSVEEIDALVSALRQVSEEFCSTA